MEPLKRIIRMIFIIIMLFSIVGILWLNFQPQIFYKTIGFRFYVVLTNSMEPIIPTYSVVFTKVIDNQEPIEPNTIVTFEANRFGEDVLLTHYFRKTQEKDGITYYRTQGATAPEYDNYETQRSDIVGEYVFHVPYVGKVILFLQSPFGYVMYGELAVIFLVNKLVLAKWEEKDKKKQEERLLGHQTVRKKQKKHKRKRKSVSIKEVSIQEEDGIKKIKGIVTSSMKKPVRFVVARLALYDEQKVLVKEDRWYLVGKEELHTNEETAFEYIVDENIADFTIDIIKYKQK